MANYSDLSGIFYIQQQYLTDLSYVPTNNSSYGDVSQKMTTLRTQLNDIYTAYRDVNPSIAKVLTKQSDMERIIEAENARLSSKKSQVDDSLYSQKRMAAFSESYSQKYQAQMKILYVVIIMALTYLALSVLHSFIPVPDILFNTVILLVVLFGGTIIILTVRDIRRRYNMDFNKINSSDPTNLIARNSGNAFFNASGFNPAWCIGEQCCPAGNPYGTVWDETTSQCKKTPSTLMGGGNTVVGFTTISQSNSQSNNIAPYSPSEINNYTAINP